MGLCLTIALLSGCSGAGSSNFSNMLPSTSGTSTEPAVLHPMASSALKAKPLVAGTNVQDDKAPAKCSTTAVSCNAAFSAAPATGQLLVASIVLKAPGITPVLPTGFSLYPTGSTGIVYGSGVTYLAIRDTGASEPTSYTFGQSASGGQLNVVVHDYANAHISTILGQKSSFNDANLDIPGQATGVIIGALALASLGSYYTTTFSSIPAQWIASLGEPFGNFHLSMWESVNYTGGDFTAMLNTSKAMGYVLVINPITTASLTHMLDNTGCQDMANNSKFNISNASAPIDPNSATYIANAAAVGVTSPGLSPTYLYAVVPSGQTLVPVGQGGRSTHPSSFPIPSYGNDLISPDADHLMELVELTNPPNCNIWEGDAFNYSGSFPTWNWTGYSGQGPIPSTGPFLNYPKLGDANGNQPCAGVSGDCPGVLGYTTTTWELNHGATHPILHVIHGESPSGMTCDAAPSTGTYPGYNANNCIHVTSLTVANFGIIRLHASYTCPSDANAAALCVALKTYGMSVDDNGCCWNVYSISESNADGRGQQLDIPSSVDSLVNGLRITDFDVIDPSWQGPGAY